MSTTVHPEFQKALDQTHVEVATLPNGQPFVIDGVTYYQASEGGAKMYQGRFMQFADIIEKHDRLKLDNTLLRGLLDTGRFNLQAAIARVHSDPEEAVNYLSKLLVLTQNASERLDLYTDLDTLGVGTQAGRLYELASVWFFTESDDPAVYDPVKAAEYIRAWVKYPDTYTFFLHLPMGLYVPLAVPSDTDILNSIRALMETNRVDWLTYQTLLSLYRRNGVTGGMITSTASRVEMLDAFDSIYEHLLMNSMNTPLPTSDIVTK